MRLRPLLASMTAVLCFSLVIPNVTIAKHNYGKYKKPNVIIFMADDLGQDAVPLYNPDDSALVQERRELGNQFPENAPMPALEALAKKGVTFRNGWAMPVCSTTRGARSTGLYPSTTGVGQVIGQFTPRRGAPGSRFDGVEFPPSMLNPDDPHFLQRLAKKRGYLTYKFGKWHEVEIEFNEADNVTRKSFDALDLTDSVAAELATQGLNDTQRAGFDEYMGVLSGFFGGINANGYGGGEIPVADQPGQAKLDDGITDAIHLVDTRSTRITDGVPDARNATSEFADSALVSRAIKLIKEAKKKGKPYFIEYSAIAPHFQYEVPPGPWDTTPPADYSGEPGGWRTLDKEIHKEVVVQIIAAFNDLDALGLTVDDIRNNLDTHGPTLYPDVGTRAPGPPPNGSPEAVAQRVAAFKGLVSYMDVQMARLLEHVDLKHTYVMFVGDNGTQGGGPVFSVTEPPIDTFKSKATVYRAGREVPFVFAGPGYVKNKWKNDLVNVTDIYATVLDIMKLKQPRNTRRSSFSFLNTLYGGKSKRWVNISEQWPATATVGGTNRIGSGAPGPFGSGARAISDGRYSLLAFNKLDENNFFVCLPGSSTLPSEDCFNEKTGIYEHVVELEFYDLEADKLEDDALIISEMSKKQRWNFYKLCRKLNSIAKRATYYQNGRICKFNGEQLRDTEPAA